MVYISFIGVASVFALLAEWPLSWIPLVVGVEFAIPLALHDPDYTPVETSRQLLYHGCVDCQFHLRRERAHLLSSMTGFNFLSAQYVLQETVECIFVAFLNGWLSLIDMYHPVRIFDPLLVLPGGWLDNLAYAHLLLSCTWTIARNQLFFLFFYQWLRENGQIWVFGNLVIVGELIILVC